MAEDKGRGRIVPTLLPGRDPEACLRRASELLAQGGLKDAAYWTALAADAIAEGKRGH